VRFLLRLIFESAGYEVSEAANGIAALILIKAALPDLVVTDMMMPMMGGAELIEHLRSEPRTARLRILAITANPRAAQVAANAAAVLSKPFDRTDLLATVNRLLAEEATR